MDLLFLKMSQNLNAKSVDENPGCEVKDYSVLIGKVKD